MRRLPSLLVNLTVLVLAIGATGWSVLLIRGDKTAATTAATGARTVTAGQGTVTATVTADGTLEPATTASAAFDTSGTVTAVYAKVGAKVTAGQLLARVDPAAAQRALDLARANLVAAKDALQRAESAGSDTTAAANEVTTAQLAVDDAEATLAGTKLIAPMSGTVIAVNGTVGSAAAAGTGGTSQGGKDTAAGFVEIANLADLQVSARFSESDATALAAGQDATITWSALPGATATGRVLTVDPSATTSDNVVTYGATISIGTLPDGAKPGQTVSVAVTTGTAENATYVNPAAVTLTGNRYTVTVRKQDGTTETRTVKVGLEGDDAYEITEGLSVGERVVLPETSSGNGDDQQQGPDSGGPPGGGSGGPP